MFFGSNLLYRSILSNQRHSNQISRYFGRLYSKMTGDVKHIVEGDAIVKSPGDKRQYRGIVLNNDLKILLISDPETDKSAASMDVNIGYMKDPPNLPGLAHFCEHMLFLGTKKYEEENEYSKYLSECGGASNAFTSAEHTNYYFDVSPDHLNGALDRFAQFFLSPLFTESATEREVNAVNSENDKNLQSDPWRMHQLEKALCNPSHDYSKFGTGNKETLETIPKSQGINPRDELLKFHSQYYSSNIMALSVLGKDSLDALAETVVPLFRDVENKNVCVPEWEEHPCSPVELYCGKYCYAIPVKDVRNLSMSWPIPDLQPYYKSNPGHYLGHLVGHEGTGSLLSELKNRGWVNTLCGGQSTGAKGFGFFKVDVDLTEDGIEHIDDIITLTYQYFNLLRETGPQEWVFDECKDLGAMNFRFKDKETPRNYVTSLSASMQNFPIEETLSARMLLKEFRPDLIDMVLGKLYPEKMRVTVIGQKFTETANQTEKWFGTKYRLENIPPEKIESWNQCGLSDKLHLPPRNDFIPTNFDIVPRETNASPLPTLIKDSPITRLWYKQDDKFLLPKSCLNFEISSHLAYFEPANHVMTNLFILLFRDALTEYTYDAELAGLSSDLSCTVYGMSLAVQGYNEKQHVFLRKILEKLTSFKVEPQRFGIFKEFYKRSLRNFLAEQPHRHAIYFTSVLMSEVAWTNVEMTQALEDITIDKLQAFIPKLLESLHIEGLIYGNYSKQDALQVSEMIENIMKQECNTKPLLPSQRKRYREFQLPDGSYYVYNQENKVHKSSSIETYYQCGQQSTRANMLIELLVQIISEPCFNVLRTKEQLGYIIFSGVRRFNGVQGLRVIVQSDRHPEHLEKHVEAFISSMESHLHEMSQEIFEKHVTSLANKRLEKPKKIVSQNNKYWSEIVSQQYNFDRDNIEVTELRTIEKEDVINFFKDYIMLSAPNRHKLSVHIVSTSPDSPNNGNMIETPVSNPEAGEAILPSPELPEPTVVTDIESFKRHLALYPLPRPYIDLTKAISKL